MRQEILKILDTSEIQYSKKSNTQALAKKLKKSNKVDWYWISIYQKLSEEFIREFQNKVDWNCISIRQKLSEEFIREFQNKVYWNWISNYQKLSEEFIREFQNKVHWIWISINQKLSEEFIREFQDKVDWYYISKYQKLSEEFIREFQNKIYLKEFKFCQESLTNYKSEKSNQTKCIWVEDQDGFWHTQCLHIFEFFDGLPSDNSFIFCPYCGETLDERRYNGINKDN